MKNTATKWTTEGTFGSSLQEESFPWDLMRKILHMLYQNTHIKRDH